MKSRCFSMFSRLHKSTASEVVIEATGDVIEVMGGARAVIVSSRAAPTSLAVKPHHGCVVHWLWGNSLFVWPWDSVVRW